MQTCDVCGESAQAYYRNGIEWLCHRHCIPENDDWFIIDGEKTIIVDKEGLELWKRHRWHFNWSVNHLYRKKWRTIENGKVKYSIVLFWVELLGFPKFKKICYLNGDKMDLRRRNLFNVRKNNTQ
jgi:hypothetical protein